MVEQALYSYRVSGSSISSTHGERQRLASVAVRKRFQGLDLSASLPRNLPRLAEALGCSVFDAGRLAYHMWHFRARFMLPEAALQPLAAILADRVLTPVTGAQAWQEALCVSSNLTSEHLVGMSAVPTS